MNYICINTNFTINLTTSDIRIMKKILTSLILIIILCCCHAKSYNLPVTLYYSFNNTAIENNLNSALITHEAKNEILQKNDQSIQVDRSRLFMIIAAAFLALITIILIIIIYNIKRKANKQIKHQNEKITKQKELIDNTMKDLKESQQRSTDILRTIPGLFFVIDKEGNFFDYHAKDANELLYPPSEFLGKNVKEILPKKVADLIHEYIKKTSETGEVMVFEYSIDIKGETKEYEATFAPAENNQFLIVSRDLTDRKRMEKNIKKTKEEAEKATEMKSMFLANLSHEIRTPLSSIIGIANVLEETNLDEEQKEYVDIINISGNNLLSLVNNILDFSKIEAGNIIIGRVPFNIHETIEEVISLLKLQATDAGNQLLSETADDIPDRVIGDPARLKQILINLVNNAIKFTKNGTITINTQLFDQDKEKLRLKFNIIDTGIGVAREKRDKLFKEFSQADVSIAKKYGGTGLGLAISKHFAAMMEGEMGVESKKGKGSNFWFTVVLYKTDLTKEQQETEEAAEKPVIPKKEDKKEIKSLNILLVEDNLLNQKFAEAILKKKNYNVDIAKNGKIGVELFEENKYDIILMDIQMPVMNGIEATKTIRALEKEKNLSPIKILAVTAYAMEGDEERFNEAGIDDYLSKPYKSDQLINKIKELLNN